MLKLGALNPYLRYILRPPSFPLARMLHARGISANQVTIASGVLLGLSLLIGVLAPFAGGQAFAVFMVAVIGINLYWFMDVIDGSVARLSRQESLLGQYLENSLYLTAGFTAALLAGWFAWLYPPVAQGWEAWTGLPAAMLLVLGAVIAMARLYRRVLLEIGERLLDKADDASAAPPDFARLSLSKRLIYGLSGAHLPLLLVATVLNALPVWLVIYAALTVVTIVYAPFSTIRQIRRLAENTGRPIS